jgi:hypothetical protein
VTWDREALPWFEQARSDLRIARLLVAIDDPNAARVEWPIELDPDDRGCHCAAMCAQTLEKSIKGYVIVNGAQPSLDHRPNKYLAELLRPEAPMLKHRSHRSRLSKFFDLPTKSIICDLFELTPGGRGNRDDLPNTEYPWREDGRWRHAPATADIFTKSESLEDWVDVARQTHELLYKLTKSAIQGSPL